MKTCLPNQLNHLRLKLPSYFTKWINIKKSYENFYRTRAGGMPAMLNGLNIKLEGRHHSGIDDCYNIAKILQKMLEDGALLNYNYMDRY